MSSSLQARWLQARVLQRLLPEAQASQLIQAAQKILIQYLSLFGIFMGVGFGFQTLQDKFFIIGLFCEVIYFLPYFDPFAKRTRAS
jgi:hypothetical protein